MKRERERERERERVRERERERESRHRPWIIFLIFCCSPSSCKMGAVIFHRLHNVVLNAKLSSSYRRVSNPTDFFPLFSIPRFPYRLSRLSFFQPIRTRHQLIADISLFLTWASADISASTFLFIYPLYPFSLSVFLLASILSLIYVPFFSTILWSTIKTVNRCL